MIYSLTTLIFVDISVPNTYRDSAQLRYLLNFVYYLNNKSIKADDLLETSI